jgi:hypothetical protein
MGSAGFSRFATVTASTKRPPAVSSGKRGVPATEISSLTCLPLDPVDAEVRERLALDTPHELLQTFAQGGLDIREGDILVVGSTEYPIRAVEDWRWPPDSADYVRLVLEELKT